jgi:hypothetical protein
MRPQPKIAACLLSLALCPAALAQSTTTTESTTVRHTVKAGEVVSVDGNNVVLREADGVHQYTLPDGFKFDLDGQSVGVDQIKPGMRVGAVITDKVTTRNVTVTTTGTATVMQVAPGGIVVKTSKGELKSYDFKDSAGNDVYMVKDGKEVPLSSVKKGDRLSGTLVSTLPPTITTERTARAKAVAPPATTVAAAEPAHLPKTASPLPFVGLLAVLSAGIALALRKARFAR